MREEHGLAAREFVRPAAVASTFYPAEASVLVEAVRDCLNVAQVPELQRVRAVIAPHAGYRYSGPVAGHSFRALAGLPKSMYTVYLMGPAHRWLVNGVGLSSADAFETPLGRVPVATERAAGLLERADTFHVVDEAHRWEHCLEVELPFLQTVLSHFAIVPMLWDDGADPAQVGDDLSGTLAADPASLVVVSSDLSHFYPYRQAVERDRAFLDALVRGDVEQVRRGSACGLQPILCLMAIAESLDWRPHLLYYANSGDTAGPRHEVVGYGAVAYTEGTA